MATLPWEIAAKTVLYAAVLAAIGVSAIRSLLLPRLTGLPSDETHAVARALCPVRTAAAAAVLVALALRAITHTAAVFGWTDTWSWDSLHVVAIESRWGSAWTIQVAAATLLLLTGLWAGRRRPALHASGHASTIACVLVCYTMPLVGHGAGSWWRVLLHGTHILGAGVWAGMLMAILLIRVPWAQRLTLLRGVSPFAFSGAAMLGLAGIVMAWSYVGSVSNLWTTPYGQLLTAKLAFVCGIAACGGMNWRRFKAERRGATHGTHLGPVAIETALAAVVVIVTAALTEVGHP